MDARARVYIPTRTCTHAQIRERMPRFGPLVLQHSRLPAATAPALPAPVRPTPLHALRRQGLLPPQHSSGGGKGKRAEVRSGGWEVMHVAAMLEGS